MLDEAERYFGCVERYDADLGQGAIRSGGGIAYELTYHNIVGNPAIRPWHIVSFVPVRLVNNGRLSATKVKIEDSGFDF